MQRNKEINDILLEAEFDSEEILAEGHGKQFIRNTLTDRYYLKVKPAVAVLITIGNRFLVRTQDRSISTDVTWELFHRDIKDNETAGNAVMNLVSDLTGLEVSFMDKLVKIYTSPNNIDEKFFLYSVVLAGDGLTEEDMMVAIREKNKGNLNVHLIDVDLFVKRMGEGQAISSTLINAIFLNSFLPNENR